MRRARSPNTRRRPRDFRLVVLRRRRAVSVDVIHRVGLDPRGTQRGGDERADGAPFRLGRRRVVRLAADAVAENLARRFWRRGARRAILLEHEDGRGFADVHALSACGRTGGTVRCRRAAGH